MNGSGSIAERIERDRERQRTAQTRRTKLATGVLGAFMLAGGIVPFLWASHSTPARPTAAPVALTLAQRLARDRATLAQLKQNASTEASAAKALSDGGGAVPTIPTLAPISIPAVHARTGASGVP